MQPDAGFGEEEEGSGKIMALANDMDPPVLPEEAEEPRLSFDEISSPLNAQLLEFCDPDLFAGEAALRTSEVGSCSNCCYEENNSYPTDQQHSLHQDINFNTQPLNEVAPTTNNLSLVCDIQNDDISASIDFSPCQQVPNITSYFTSTNPQDGLNFSHIQVTDNSVCSVILDGLQDNIPYQMNNNALISQCPPPQLLPPVFEDECFSSVHSFLHMNPPNPAPPPSCSWLDFSLRPLLNLSPGALSVVGSGDASQMFGGSNLLMGAESQTREMDFIGDNNGLFCSDSIQRAFHSNEIQALCGEGPGQWMIPGGTNENNLSTEMSSLDEANYKVAKLSVKQRKEKIHRYLKKRNERNFSKKIKYACRKTLADSRPRVRGRFAKNDEYVGRNDHRYGHHDEDEDDDVHVKDEEDNLDSDIFAHISGVNSFKFSSNPVQSWM